MPVGTISSLQQQDYPNLEVVFIDDGKIDNTYRGCFGTFTGNWAGTRIYQTKRRQVSGPELWDPDSRQRIRGMYRCRYPVEKDAVRELMKIY